MKNVTKIIECKLLWSFSDNKMYWLFIGISYSIANNEGLFLNADYYDDKNKFLLLNVVYSFNNNF